jgi:hypothetical protein
VNSTSMACASFEFPSTGSVLLLTSFALM